MTVTRHRRSRIGSVGFAFLLVWLTAALPAAAHADLVSSVPAKGATIAPTAAPIVLTFSEAMKASSHADIIAPSGTKLGSATLDPGDNTRLVYTPTRPLDPGVWTVKWTAVALDGHLLRDDYTFTVTAPPPSAAPSASPTPAPSATAAPTAAPSPAPTPTPIDASPTGTTVLLPVLAALVAIAILGLVLLRNRRPSARR